MNNSVFVLVAPICTILSCGFAGSQIVAANLDSDDSDAEEAPLLAPIQRPSLQYNWFNYIGTNAYVTTMTSDELKASPEWDPSRPLPISLARAEEIARAELTRFVADAASWNAIEIELKRSLEFERQRRWFYVFVMKPQQASTPGAFQRFVVAMTLAGVVCKIEENHFKELTRRRVTVHNPAPRLDSDPYFPKGELSEVGSKSYWSSVPSEASGSAWEPAMELPLSFAEVENIAYAELKRIVGSTASLAVSEFKLQHRLTSSGHRAWFYGISMESDPEAMRVGKHERFIVMLNLSGVVGTITEVERVARPVAR